MIAIQTPREPCFERYVVAFVATTRSASDAVDATMIAFSMRSIRRERPVKLMQHPAFRRAGDLGPDPGFTLDGRALHLRQEIARGA